MFGAGASKQNHSYPLSGDPGRVSREIAVKIGNDTRTSHTSSCGNSCLRDANQNQRGVRAVADDPDDDKVIECALAGEAAYIVSGDRHLLDLKEYEGIVIVRANEFLALVTE